MKQSLGITAMVAVAIAVARIPAGAPASQSDSPAAGPAAVHASRTQVGPAPPALYHGGCTIFDAEAESSTAPKYPRDANRGAARSLFNGFFALSKGATLKDRHNIRYAVALAPDPRHTHLSLMFDREMVAVQQAAQDEGYTFNSSWLPWGSEPPTFDHIEDQQRAEDLAEAREACPGILLFRRGISDVTPAVPSVTAPAPGTPASVNLYAPARPADPYAEALVVFVVGEQPTGGINQNQWGNALAWLQNNVSAQATPKDKTPLAILGPSFSGSLVSLARDLAALPSAPQAFPSSTTPISIFSGSVSSCSSTRWFQQRLNELNTSKIAFGSFQENDELQIYRLLSYLSQQGTETSDVAVLSEDETAYAYAYSAAPSTPHAAPSDPSAAQACEFPYADTTRSIRISYPRDISALRIAYEKQSVFSSSSVSHNHPILQESTAVDTDASQSSDTIRTFSGAMTPIAQEAILYGIVSYLRSHHAHYIVLRCTNPLDFLFLTRFFHRAYPEGRVVTVGSDLLYRREIDTTEFRGVLSLSNYPLLPRDQHWAHLSNLSGRPLPSPHTHRVFDSHLEGTYLAARYLFDQNIGLPAVTDHQQPLLLPFKANIPDFADPYWLHGPQDVLPWFQPPTWLTVVGRDGYWPIAVFNPQTTPSECLDEPLTPTQLLEKGKQQKLAQRRFSFGASAPSQPCPSHPLPPSTMVRVQGTGVHYDLRTFSPATFDRGLLFNVPLPLRICLGCALFLLAYQIFGIWRGRDYTSVGLFALFRRDFTPSHAFLLGVNSAFAAAILTQLLWVVLELPSGNDFVQNLGSLNWYAVLGALLVLVLFVYMLVIELPRSSIALAPFIAVTFSIVFAPFYAFYIYQDRANSIPLFYRMGHIFSGVSPLVPVIFLLLGFYLATWQAMAGNSLLCNGRPMLPRLRSVPAIRSRFHRLYFRFIGLETRSNPDQGSHLLTRSEYRISGEMEKRILHAASPVSIELRVIFLPAIVFIIAWRYVALTGPPLLSLESYAFAECINGVLLAAFLLTTAEASRLFFTWIELRRLLTALNRQRLRRTFAKLRAFSFGSLWSVSGDVQRIQFLFFSQQLDAANRLTRLAPGKCPLTEHAVTAGRAFASLSAPRLNTGPRWEAPTTLDPRKYPDIPKVVDIRIREVFNSAAGEVFNKILLPAWRVEDHSLNLQTRPGSAEEHERNACDMALSSDVAVQAAEEFLTLHYIAFIQNVLARMRTMILSMVCLFIAVCLSISSYPFVPRTQIGMWMLVNLLFIAGAVIYVYAGMEKDETLSYITNTASGKLSMDFYIKTAGFLAGPVIGLVTTQFPAISESILGWLQPGFDTLSR